VLTETSTIIKTTEYAFTADEQVQIWREAMVRWADFTLAVFWIAGIPALMSIVIAMRGGTPWLGVLLCVVAITGGMLYPGWRAKSIRRENAALKAAGQVVRQRHEFDGRFITTYLSDGQESRLELDDFKIYVVTNNILYLYIAQKNYLPIPLRAFDESTEMEDLFGMLKANHVTLKLNHPKGGWKQW